VTLVLRRQKHFGGQASTLSRVFQVQEMARAEVVDKRVVRAGNLFQVRFKLFQVRVGSGWKSDGCGEASGKGGENGRKAAEISHKGREGWERNRIKLQAGEF